MPSGTLENLGLEQIPGRGRFGEAERVPEGRPMSRVLEEEKTQGTWRRPPRWEGHRRGPVGSNADEKVCPAESRMGMT